MSTEKKTTGLQLRLIAQMLTQTTKAAVAVAKLLHELTDGQFAVPERPEMALPMMVQLLERHAAHLEANRPLEGLSEEELAAKLATAEAERTEAIRSEAAAALEALQPKPAEPEPEPEADQPPGEKNEGDDTDDDADKEDKDGQPNGDESPPSDPVV